MRKLNSLRTAYHTMAYDNHRNVVYVVSPDYRIWEIDVATNTLYQEPRVSTPPSLNNTYFAGSIIIKYDPTSRWLFYAAQGQWELSDYLPQYFGAYDTEQLFGNTFALMNGWFFQSGANYSFPDIHDIHIEPNGYFYMSRKKNVEVWQINEPNGSVAKINALSLETDEYKHGRIINLEDNNPSMNKILVLPMSNRTSPANIYVWDGNDPYSVTLQSLFPDELINNNIKKILFAEYYSETNKLILAVKPDNDAISNPTYDDIYIYNVSIGTGNELELEFSASINVNTDGLPTVDRNNYPTYMKLSMDTNPNGNKDKVLLSKKDAMGYLDLTNNTYHNIDQSNDYYNNYFERIVESDDPNTFYVLNLANSTFGTINCPSSLFGNPVTFSLNTAYSGQYFSNGVYNPINKKVYLFGSQKASNSKIIAINTNDNSIINEIIVDFPIGDCILNPYTNETILSDFNGNTFFTYSEDLSSITNTISSSNGASHMSSMYISPNGLLYITLGMKAYTGLH